LDLLLPSLTGSRKTAGEKLVLEARQELLRLWASDPWEWLCGQDLDGRPIIWTKDERDDKAPRRPFPCHKAYLKRFLTIDAWGPEPLFVDKARQMYVSTGLLNLMHWYCLFNPARRGIISKHKEGEAEQLIRDKIRETHRQLPGWVQEALPISMTPANRVEYYNTGSSIHGVAQNFAVAEARGQTASVVLVDEAAFQDMLSDMLTAVLPMSSRLWVVTTARAAGRGAKVFKDMIER
jgi:hypothetical protein